MTTLRNFLTQAACLATAAVAIPLATSASTVTSPITVAADVTQTCTVSTTTNLAFGSYDPVSANKLTDLAGSAVLSVACTKDASGVTIGIDNGANAVGAQRNLLGATNGDKLAYNLYQDAAHTQPWNDSTHTASFAPTSDAAVPVTVYALVTHGQDVSVDSYADSVTATVNY